MKQYDDGNFRELIRPPQTEDGGPEALPRRTVYGSGDAGEHGLIPMLDYPDVMVTQDTLGDVIAECHANRSFPMYHQEAAGWAVGWSQNGLGYCWAYGLTAGVMECRQAQGMPHVMLSPESLGWLVNWRNQGYYLDAAIKGARDRGIATREYVPQHQLNPGRFKVGWEKNAKLYRPLEWWDTRRTSDVSMLLQCATGLASGRPGYIAYNWWGHALELVGLRYQVDLYLNVAWIIRNSHGERDYIELTGTRGVPDECYFPRTVSLPL